MHCHEYKGWEPPVVNHNTNSHYFINFCAVDFYIRIQCYKEEYEVLLVIQVKEIVEIK